MCECLPGRFVANTIMVTFLSFNSSAIIWQKPITLISLKQQIIPHICHGRHGRRPCKFFWDGVNFYRFNAKNWQFTVYFAVITQKLAIFCVFCRNLRVFSVKILFSKNFACVKKMTNMRYAQIGKV